MTDAAAAHSRYQRNVSDQAVHRPEDRRTQLPPETSRWCGSVSSVDCRLESLFIEPLLSSSLHERVLMYMPLASKLRPSVLDP